MNFDKNIFLILLLGCVFVYYYSTSKNTNNVINNENYIESEMENKEKDILSEESNYDTEKFLNDNLLDDINLHDNNDQDFLNNIENLLEKEDELNNMLENNNIISEKKNVEEYSIEFKDGSDKQDIQTTIENNMHAVDDNMQAVDDNMRADIDKNMPSSVDNYNNWENNSLMFREVLKENNNVKKNNMNEILGYSNDMYYNLH